MMDLRAARHAMRRERGALRKKAIHQHIRLRLLQIRQLLKRSAKVQEMQRCGTQAGVKVTPEPPRVAIKARPSPLPPHAYRGRVPEAGNGWVVRPHVEPHGVDGGDAMEGFYLEKSGVARRNREELLAGSPYHHYASAQVTKDQARAVGPPPAALPPCLALLAYCARCPKLPCARWLPPRALPSSPSPTPPPLNPPPTPQPPTPPSI